MPSAYFRWSQARFFIFLMLVLVCVVSMSAASESGDSGGDPGISFFTNLVRSLRPQFLVCNADHDLVLRISNSDAWHRAEPISKLFICFSNWSFLLGKQFVTKCYLERHTIWERLCVDPRISNVIFTFINLPSSYSYCGHLLSLSLFFYWQNYFRKTFIQYSSKINEIFVLKLIVTMTKRISISDQCYYN